MANELFVIIMENLSRVLLFNKREVAMYNVSAANP